MKKMTKEGGWEPMTPVEEAVMLIGISITSAICGAALYKLWQLFF